MGEEVTMIKQYDGEMGRFRKLLANDACTLCIAH